MYNSGMAKKLVSIRMSEVEQELLETLIGKLGATQASVVAMGLRELAKKEGVAIPTATANPEKETK
jgi:hypothetical protein